MRYMGSKRRIAKCILPIILKDRQPEQWYVEPFVGSATVIDKVEGNRLGADINEYLIEALKLIRDNVEALPKNNSEFTKQDYMTIKYNKELYDKGLVGYVGFALSFGGVFFAGWAHDTRKRDYVAESFRNVVKQSPKLQNIKFLSCSYDALEIPSNSIIYCDPPYENTTKYKDAINHAEFWQWCREKTTEGHKVFVSGYSAPDDFVCVWQKEILCTMRVDSNYDKVTEKLFVYSCQI